MGKRADAFDGDHEVCGITDSAPLNMKRLLLLIVVVAFLALTPAAFAKWNWRTSMEAGNQFSARSTSGSCTVNRVLLAAVLRCGSDTGQASVRYTFKVPSNCLPKVNVHVDAIGHRKVSVATTTGQVRVTVRTDGQGLLTIASAGIGYYC